MAVGTFGRGKAPAKKGKAPAKKGMPPQFQKKNVREPGDTSGDDTYVYTPCTTKCLKTGKTKAQCMKQCA